MKVSIKSFDVGMILGNNGVEFEVSDPSGQEHLGDLRVGKGTIEWCKGRTRAGNGVQVRWDELIGWFESKR